MTRCCTCVVDKEQDVDLPVLSRAVSTVTVSQASVTTVPTFSIALERLVASDKVGSGTGDTVTSGKVDSVTGDTVDSDKAPPTDVTDLQAPPTDDEDDAFLHVTFNFALNSDGHKVLIQVYRVNVTLLPQNTNPQVLYYKVVNVMLLPQNINPQIYVQCMLLPQNIDPKYMYSASPRLIYRRGVSTYSRLHN